MNMFSGVCKKGRFWCAAVLQVDNIHLVHGDVMRLNMDDLIADLAQRQQERKVSHAQASTSGSSSSSNSESSSSSSGSGERRRKVKVVANLPYNITKDFLRALLPRGQHISALSIMIQVRQQPE
jgi:16S rRNA A1518/A1519 N6-dimethyltransferase RsmA/KsgA/DIM1 with predicted DNA glycosylase/AP lyase activity